MTRETKIGLLVGLGFIVVFAVLLSHTGSVPPPNAGVTHDLVQNKPVDKPVLSGGIRGEIGQPEPPPPVIEDSPVPGSGPAEPVRFHLEERVVTIDDLPDLPAPTALEPAPTAVASSGPRRGEMPVDTPVSILSMHRRAPDLPVVQEPEPSAPHAPPAQTSPPDASATALAEGSQKTAPSLRPAREYVVQSGDSLVKIAKKHYPSSDPRLIEFLVNCNEGRIKDADTIFEGQTLLIPDLPPEMFEQAPNFDVRLASGRAISMEEFMNSQRRQAPPATSAEPAAPKSADRNRTAPGPVEDTSVKLSLKGLVPVRPSTSAARAQNAKSSAASAPPARRDSGKDAQGSDDGDQMYRLYEVKPNDTLGSIARKELGSSRHWPEIKKLNSHIDPQRMQVGETIKLPRKPLSSSSGTGRPSA